MQLLRRIQIAEPDLGSVNSSTLQLVCYDLHGAGTWGWGLGFGVLGFGFWGLGFGVSVLYEDQ